MATVSKPVQATKVYTVWQTITVDPTLLSKDRPIQVPDQPRLLRNHLTIFFKIRTGHSGTCKKQKQRKRRKTRFTVAKNLSCNNANKQVLLTHIFNLSTWETEAGRSL